MRRLNPNDYRRYRRHLEAEEINNSNEPGPKEKHSEKVFGKRIEAINKNLQSPEILSVMNLI